jgi:hypothetical protein
MTKLSIEKNLDSDELLSYLDNSLDENLSTNEINVYFSRCEGLPDVFIDHVFNFLDDQKDGGESCGFRYDQEEGDYECFGKGDIYYHIDFYVNGNVANNYDFSRSSDLPDKIIRGDFSYFEEADINEPLNQFGQTKLLFAARYGAMDTLDDLLKSGADINVKNIFGSDVLAEFLQGGIERKEPVLDIRKNMKR